MKTATSRTGERRRHRADAGFTLFEVLVVMAVVAAVVAAAILIPRSGSETASVKSTAFATTALLRHARSTAILQGRETTVLVDLARRVVRAGNSLKPIAIAKGVKVAMQASAGQRQSRRVAGIRFFPDGSSTGGRLVFSRKTQRILVTVNWLNGRVSITDVR